MLRRLLLTDKPCVLCGNKQDAAEVKFKDGSFSGVLCKEHLWEILKRKKTIEAAEEDQPQKTVT